MTYTTYIRFYGLTDNKENREAWIYSQWNKGNIYKENGEFYSVETGKKVF